MSQEIHEDHLDIIGNGWRFSEVLQSMNLCIQVDSDSMRHDSIILRLFSQTVHEISFLYIKFATKEYWIV